MIDFPSSGLTVGQLFQASNGGTYQWNGTFWLPVGNSSILTTSDTPPPSPGPGQLWFNSTLGQLFIWFDDTTSAQWVPANPVPMVAGQGDFSAAYNGVDYALSGTSQVLIPPVIAGNASGAYNASNGRWTPPAGRYVISAACSFLYTGGNTGSYLQIRKNGTALASSFQSTQIGFTVAPALSIEVDANGSDFFDLFLTGYTAGSLGRQNSFTAIPVSGIKGPPGDPGVKGLPGDTGATGTAGSSLLQTVTFLTGAQANNAALIPVDDTIPQITEGAQFMQLAITPLNAASRLIITVNTMLANSAIAWIATALFRDSTANALRATTVYQGTATGGVALSFQHVAASGSTAPTTFRVRCGSNTGTTLFNSNGVGVGVFGGVAASSIVIQEVFP